MVTKQEYANLFRSAASDKNMLKDLLQVIKNYPDVIKYQNINNCIIFECWENENWLNGWDRISLPNIRYKILKAYTNAGFDVNSITIDGYYLLQHVCMGASTKYDIKCIKLLLELGADPNLSMNEDDTCLHIMMDHAITNTFELAVKIIQMLLKYNADDMLIINHQPMMGVGMVADAHHKAVISLARARNELEIMHTVNTSLQGMNHKLLFLRIIEKSWMDLYMPTEVLNNILGYYKNMN
jgi:hypothetical protein